MSRSNDVGTSVVAIRCTKDGISVEGARDIGSTSDTRVGSLSQFLRVAECWWNTYCEKSSRQETDCHGNAAAMREALIETQSTIARCMDILNEIPDTCGYGGLIDDAADELCALREGHLKDALSAPPRNCDVGTAEEQAKRFQDFCDDSQVDEDYTSMCARCTLRREKHCELAWAQMPYEDEAREQ